MKIHRFLTIAFSQRFCMFEIFIIKSWERHLKWISCSIYTVIKKTFVFFSLPTIIDLSSSSLFCCIIVNEVFDFQIWSGVFSFILCNKHSCSKTRERGRALGSFKCSFLFQLVAFQTIKGRIGKGEERKTQ